VRQTPRTHCEERLRLRANGFAGRLVAVLEVPLELADGRGVQRRLQLLADYRLVWAILADPIEQMLDGSAVFDTLTIASVVSSG
jgi:hypothetical protein